MKERIPCMFFIIRYVPDEVRGEFVNIGVVLWQAMPETASSGEELAVIRFTKDWAKVQRFDPFVDIELLHSLEDYLQNRVWEEADDLAPKPDLGPLSASLGESPSNSIQMTEPSGCLAESMDAEMNRLMRMYVD